MHTLDKLQETIRYRFKNVHLLETALSHSSYANEHKALQEEDNERLEFLGDAVLELLSSDFLFHTYPDMPEGNMTKLRASLVCEPTLAMCARQISLPEYLRLGKGEERTGGRDRNSIISDAMEAVIGAIYLDGGLEQARQYIETFIMNDLENKKLFYDSKTVLQEIVQKDFRTEEIHYEMVDEVGPDHAKKFVVDIRIGSQIFGRGCGSTKKAAEQEAAYNAILKIRE